MKNKPHKLWVLFLTTLYISAFTFGGGFVIVTFMKHKFVDELHWIDEQEMLDFTALAQSCPGAIAVNAAILVGWNVYGFAGMIVATLGTILPPMIILSVVSFFYAIFSTNVWVAVVLKGMQAGDLICYGGHVAIYMGNGQIVHASNSRDGIKISNNAAYRTILSVRRPS